VNYRGDLSRALSRLAQEERRAERSQLIVNRRRLGRCRKLLGCSGNGRDGAVQWEGGEEAASLEAMRSRISEQKQEIDRLRNPRKTFRAEQQQGDKQLNAEDEEDFIWEQNELRNSKDAAVKRDEADLREREQRLQIERRDYLRQMRALDQEDQVNYGSFPPLRHRYQLLRLLSRKKQVDVYRAHDLATLSPCLLRIHRLGAAAGAKERDAQLEAISRECEQVRLLKNTAVASLLDHFSVEGGSSYAVVWEFCKGDTLESYMLRNAPLLEKDARGVLMQMLSIAKLAEARGHRLQGQDLKPSRLILCGGEVRATAVTHLSLSQPRGRTLERTVSSQLDERESWRTDSLEDFCTGDDTGLISMVAITLHEMLFGRRPEYQANQPSVVQLPDQPKVSVECREYLTWLLDRDRRPTVQEAYSDPFIMPTRRQR